MESTFFLHHHNGGLRALPAAMMKPAPKSSAGRANTATRNPKPGQPYRVSASLMAAGQGPESGKQEPRMTVYHDNWFDRLAIHHLSRSIQLATGIEVEKEGYEGFVSAASSVARNFDAKGQHELVMVALRKAFPKPILDAIRFVTPPSRFTREFFAVFTTMFFPWLVGKCEVKESEFQGKREKNVVYIPKCRFLEETNCVGMCTTLCKVPSQTFIHESLGMPVNMVPNFEDMSCEMIFGQHPPEDDPALKQPCYKKLCIAKKTHGVNCSS